MKVKNNKETADTWVGMTIEPAAYYEIEAVELHKWQNNSKVFTDIGSGDLIVNNDTSDITDVATAINYLKGIDTSPKDVDGSPLHRVKITSSGWHYQLHGIEFETSKLSPVANKKVNNTDYNYTAMKFYKLSGESEVEITGEDLNQAFLDANCIKTTLTWEPTHDMELVGGMLKQENTPAEDVKLWVVGVPDVPEAYGGSKPFCVNINLRYLGSEEGIKVDGKAPKYLAYSATYHTTKMQLILRHPVGFNHKIHMIFELFKA